MNRIISLLVVLSIAQPLLTQNMPEIVMLKGDVTNMYMDELFNNNKLESSNAEITYSSNSNAAVVTNIQELTGDLLASSTIACRHSRRYNLIDSSKLLVASCGNNHIDVYTVGAGNKLAFQASRSFNTGSQSQSWDFLMADTSIGSIVAVSYESRVDAAGKVGPSVTFVTNAANLKRKSFNMFDFPETEPKMKDYLKITSWTSVARKTLHFAYNTPIGPFLAADAPKYILYADMSDDSGETEKTGKLDLNAANGFCEDVRGMIHLSFSDNDRLFATYAPMSGANMKACGCTVAYDAATNALTLSDCTPILNFAPGPGYMALSLPNSASKNGKAIYFIPSETDIKKRKLYYCEFDGARVLDCYENHELVNYSDALEFNSVQIGPHGDEVTFRKKNMPEGTYPRVVTVIYNLAKNRELARLTYNEISDRGGFTICSGGSQGLPVVAFALTRNAYSVYGPNPNKWYTSFIANNVEGGVNVATITKKEAGKTEVTKTFRILIRTSLNAVSGATSLPNYHDFITGITIDLPPSRMYYYGNNLDFRLADNTPDGFELTGSHVEFRFPELKDKPYFASATHGVAMNEGKITRFSCINSVINKNLNCVLDKVTYPIAEGHEIIYVTSSNYGPEDSIIVVTSDQTNSDFINIGTKLDQVTFHHVAGLASKKNQVFFKLILTKPGLEMPTFSYSIWVGTEKAVNIYASNSKDFKQFSSVPFRILDNKDIGTLEGTFCPQKILSNGLDSSMIEVNSNCPSGVAKLFRFKAPYKDQITYQSSKLLNNPELGGGTVDICSFGEEHLLYSKDNKFVFTADTDDDYSLNMLGEGLLGYNSVEGIECIEGAAGAIFYGIKDGQNQMSVINGNRAGNIDDRYFITFGITGTILSAISTPYGYMITHGTTEAFIHQAILLNAPFLRYHSNKRLLETVITINVTQNRQPAFISSNFFKMKIDDYLPRFTVNKIENQTTYEGSYPLFQLAEVKGDVSNIDVKREASAQDKNISISSRVVVDEEFVPTTSPRVPEPDKIITHKTSSHLIGFYHNKLTLYTYYYQDHTKFLGREDTGFDTQVYDAVINQDEFTLVCIGTNEGGVHNLRWSIKKPGSPLNHGIIAEDFEAHYVNIVEISPIRYALIAINRKFYTGKTWILDVSQDAQGKYQVTSSPGTTFKNIYSAVGFEFGNSAVFLINNNQQTTFKVIEISDSGSHTTKTDIRFPDELQIQETKCFVYNIDGKNEVHCIIKFLGYIIGDLVIEHIENNYSVKTYKRYKYFFDFRPLSFDFNKDFLVVKARNTKKELMLVYKRSSEEEGLYWSLDVKEYYNMPGPFTPSTPTVYSKGTETKIAFTQDQSNVPTQSKLLKKSLKEGERGTFYQFQPAEAMLTLGSNITLGEANNVKIVFNEGITELSGHYIEMMNFFNGTAIPPAPPAPSKSTEEDNPNQIPWWVWVIIGMIVFLIFVAFLLRFLTREKDDLEEEEDIYYNTKERLEMETAGAK